jgi:hypothetical protein
MGGITATNAHIAKLADFATAVDACRNQLADLDRQTAEIKNTELAGLAATVGECRNQLANLAYQTAAIEAGLPRPPATRWLALAIVTVLVLGIGAGTALRHPEAIAKLVADIRS